MRRARARTADNDPMSAAAREALRVTLVGHRVGARYSAASERREGVTLGHYGSLCLHRVLTLEGLADCFAIKCVRCGHRWCNPTLDRASLRVYAAAGASAKVLARGKRGRR